MASNHNIQNENKVDPTQNESNQIQDERVRRSSRRYSVCGLTGIKEESNQAQHPEQPNSGRSGIGSYNMNGNGYDVRSRSRRALSVSDSESLEQYLRQKPTITSFVQAQEFTSTENIENVEPPQPSSFNGRPTANSQEQNTQSQMTPDRTILTRRPSIQCEAILTGTSVCSTNPNILSGVNLQPAFPSPLHAVLMQYGKNEKGTPLRRHSTVDHRSDKFNKLLQTHDNDSICGDRMKASFETIPEVPNVLRTSPEMRTESQLSASQRDKSATNNAERSYDYKSNDTDKTSVRRCNNTRETRGPQNNVTGDETEYSETKNHKSIKVDEPRDHQDEIPISQLTINNINKYNSMLANQEVNSSKNSLKQLKRQMSLDAIQEKCPNFIPRIAEEKFRKMSQPSNFYSQLSKENNQNEPSPKDLGIERRHSLQVYRTGSSADSSDRKSLSVFSDEGYCTSIPSTPRGQHKLSLASDCSWISADIDESASSCFDLRSLSKQDDEEGICDKENIDTLNRRRYRSKCDDKNNNNSAKYVDGRVEESMKESVQRTFKQTSV